MTRRFPDVYHLPPPVKEESISARCRIPALLPQVNETLNIHQEAEHAPPPEQLLLDHMIRWKQVRDSWQDAGYMNEMRYSASLNILRQIFERNAKDC